MPVAQLEPNPTDDVAVQNADPAVDEALRRLAAYVRQASQRRDVTGEDLAAALDAERPGPTGSTLAKSYLDTIVAGFVSAQPRIHVVCDPALQLPAADLAPVGMFVSEAISNALRHAFPPGRDGDIWVRLAEGGGRLTLAVRDNGVGMPDLSGDAGASGRGVIEASGHRLGGRARMGSAPFGGADVSVIWPRNEAR